MGGRGSSSSGGGGAAQAAGESRYNELQAGKTLSVVTPEGKAFGVRTRKFAGITGYQILKPNGRPDPRGGSPIMTKSEAIDWLSGLKNAP
jgi:hypothetical protein